MLSSEMRVRLDNDSGKKPMNWFSDRSRKVSLERVLIWVGMVPLSELLLRSRSTRFGKEEKLKLSSLPSKLALCRLISVTLRASSHTIPDQLHGEIPLVLPGSDHELRALF
ncbi:hypothetical protein MRB53_003601 [Persea americana]|uniref:Uncharacterized protein n=1 Tax=Persea americana TaxID=3435 RepID=A0ACC2MYR0_PERAE|nr:hypothetical protein MRB53_003601 [Persea americana]